MGTSALITTWKLRRIQIFLGILECVLSKYNILVSYINCWGKKIKYVLNANATWKIWGLLRIDAVSMEFSKSKFCVIITSHFYTNSASVLHKNVNEMSV